MVGVDSGHELAVGGMSKMERRSPVCREVVGHVLVGPCVVPAGSGFNVRASKLPGFDLFWTKDVSVDLFELIPLIVGSLRIEGICRAAMVEARNGFLNWYVGVGSSLSSVVAPIGLIGAVTSVGLAGPLPERDVLDLAPSRGREGYVVSPKSGERVGSAVRGGMVSIPNPWDGQCLSGEVGR